MDPQLQHTDMELKAGVSEDEKLKSEKDDAVMVGPEKMETIGLGSEKDEDVKLKPDNFEDVQLQLIEDVMKEGPSYRCDLSDTEIVYKISQELLSGLATACVDNTTGGIFKTPATVAVEIRKEMVEYLTQRSESFVAESVVLEGDSELDVSDHPLDIISVFLDDFGAMKRNWVSRVSGWLLSEMREDKVDDFVQEMELNRFWVLDRREAVARVLLKNVDFKNLYHCDRKFKSEEELNEHRTGCGFRSVICENDGCGAMFTAAHLDDHDSTCPFKVILCEQKCSEYLLRREMDRHCITVCPMKLVNCPFYSIGCHTPVPQCTVKEHFSENLHSHLLCILRFIHKEASVEYIEQRAEQIEKSSLSSGLEGIQAVKFLSIAVKNIEQKLGPLKVLEEDTNEKNLEGSEIDASQLENTGN